MLILETLFISLNISYKQQNKDYFKAKFHKFWKQKENREI